MSNDKENIEQEKKNKIFYRRNNIGMKQYILFTLFLLFLLFNTPYAKGFDMKELLPIKHNIFVKGPNMHVYHNGPAVLMNDGNVLVIGGDTKQAEIYDYKKNKFVLTKGKMNYIRSVGATATKLNNGKVLILGGAVNSKSFNTIQNEEIYNTATGMFSKIPNMCIPRADHTAILMDNGNVLIFGGNNDKNLDIKDIEEYNYLNNTFKIINTVDVPNHYWVHFINIGNNKVLLIGYKIGTSENPIFYIYDYDKNKIYKYEKKPKLDNIDIKRDIYATNFPLHTRVIYATIKNGAVIIDRQDNDIVNISFITEKINEKNYTSTLLDNNEVIFIGGYWDGWGRRYTRDSYLVSLNGSITKNKPLNILRSNHQAIKLNNGNILILGGYNTTNGNQYYPIVKSEIYYKE